MLIKINLLRLLNIDNYANKLYNYLYILRGNLMEHIITYSKARGKFKSICDMACDDHLPVVVTRKNGKNVVILSEEDYRALDETSYLLSSPVNAKHLKQGLKDVKIGKVGHIFNKVEELPE